jgi:DNA-binding transcriptional LysR family regulator
MPDIDLNLLTALDALLTTGSVAGAARKLQLSASATSRTLARLRAATGDPLLVRAGRGLVPTPHALALQTRVRDLAQEAQNVLRPATIGPDFRALERTFAIRASDGFIEVLGARLVAAVALEAPRARLRFAPKPDKDVRPLRDGEIDLDIGVLGETGPEIRVKALFRDEFIGAVRLGHPLLEGAITPERYVAHGHVVASRRGQASGPVDDALSALGLQRRIVAVVPGFSAALAIARGSDLVALVTRSFMGAATPHADPVWRGVQSIPLPVKTQGIAISQMWHPRFDADPVHRWLREKVQEACSRSFASPATIAKSESRTSVQRRLSIKRLMGDAS